MASTKDKLFFVESFSFMSHLVEFNENLITELKQISSGDYMEKFERVVRSIKMASNRIKLFIDYWKDDDDEKICNTIKTINEYYAFYCTTLNNSSPSSYMRDSKYLIDSLTTAKLALKSKLKYLNEHGK